MHRTEKCRLLHDCRADSQGEETDRAVNQAHDGDAQSGEELQLHVWLRLLHNHSHIHECSSKHASTWQQGLETSSSSVQHHAKVGSLKSLGSWLCLKLMSSFLCASKPADMKMISGLKRATAGKILSRHARFHMGTCAPGPGIPTLIIRGPSPWGAASAPNSLSGSSTMSSCTRLHVRQGLPHGIQFALRHVDHKGLFTLGTGMCPGFIV